jgi:hypothetical protein
MNNHMDRLTDQSKEGETGGQRARKTEGYTEKGTGGET